MVFRLVLLFLAVGLTLPRAAHACSVSRFGAERAATSTFFLGVATTDTARAGPGTVTYYRGDSPSRDPQENPPRPIYGQVVRLERIGGFLADSVRRIAAGAGGEVVVVPWGYRADCRRIAWGESARWVPPGSRGVFVARLRPREHWAGDRPTFDVSSGWHDPFPHGRFLGLEKLPPDSVLSAEQYFSFHRALPDAEALQRDPEAALRPLREWVRGHPALTSRVPVPEIVRSAAVSAEYARVAALTPAVVGTYRIVVSAEGEPPRELYFRTSRRPTPWFWTREPRGPAPPGEVVVPRSTGYRLRVRAAEAEAGIPATSRRALDDPRCTPGALIVSSEPTRPDAGAEVWRAFLDWSLLPSCLPEHEAARRAVETVHARFREGTYQRLPGEFRRDGDGTMRFEQTLLVSGHPLIRITGERISTDTLDPG